MCYPNIPRRYRWRVVDECESRERKTGKICSSAPKKIKDEITLPRK